MPPQVQLKDCRFIAQALTREAADERAELERKSGLCVRIVIRHTDDGARVWRLFETGKRTAPALSSCPTCRGKGRVPEGSLGHWVHGPGEDVESLRRQLHEAQKRLGELERGFCHEPPKPVAAPPAPKPPKRSKGSQWPTPDPRLPSNTKAHFEPPYVGPELKGASAARERKRRMEACLCRLCALCLRPALTFAEAETFGLDFSDCQPPTRKWSDVDGNASHLTPMTRVNPNIAA